MYFSKKTDNYAEKYKEINIDEREWVCGGWMGGVGGCGGWVGATPSPFADSFEIGLYNFKNVYNFLYFDILITMNNK